MKSVRVHFTNQVRRLLLQNDLGHRSKPSIRGWAHFRTMRSLFVAIAITVQAMNAESNMRPDSNNQPTRSVPNLDVGLLAKAGIVIHTETGEIPWTKELLHEVMKNKFLLIGEVKSKSGRTIPIYQSTASLCKEKFSEFVQNVKNLAYQFWGIDIPEPPVKSIYREWEK